MKLKVNDEATLVLNDYKENCIVKEITDTTITVTKNVHRILQFDIASLKDDYFSPIKTQFVSDYKLYNGVLIWN